MFDFVDYVDDDDGDGNDVAVDYDNVIDVKFFVIDSPLLRLLDQTPCLYPPAYLVDWYYHF